MNPHIEFSEDQRDCLQEVCNIAMGQAGNSLARLFERFVTLSVPAIGFVSAENVETELQELMGSLMVSAVRQAFFSTHGKEGLHGEAIVVFSDTNFEKLVQLADYHEGPSNAAIEQELLLDISNVLSGACLNGIAEQLEEQLGFSAPSLIGTNIPLAGILDHEQLTWEQAMSIKIGYRLEEIEFQCDMLLLLPKIAVEHLKNTLDFLLEDD
ncbi:hypothetical protein [Motiliproteus sp. MSK22-1]|uniref:hypothetical protein n=1 Tax=Motiliproteus sp. MSK22-1 TaxID=1897630 RepID=UPI000977FBCC|nr:hypothetical protein [Motiliproteus sp. MSK22-1]OMH33976.1 hypothetical protein BGP75_13510 [Motiliproteus sp. MSK22-1]